MKFKIITKKNCFFCEKLIGWLNNNNVEYKEIDYLEPKDSKDPILKNEKFYSIYCDMSACVESLPIIVKNDEEFFYGEVWDLVNNTIIEEKAKKVFEI